ncbi:hypothetical protein VM94_04799 [Janthinobacterium sp. KBS0711]|nr:hypothetical protein VM94_04799 [Janthinobacterium sp. KBS0711]
MVALNGAPAPVLLSLTWMLTGKLPATLVVPDTTPVDAFKVKPAGRLPLLMLKVYGAVPPVAVRVAV